MSDEYKSTTDIFKMEFVFKFIGVKYERMHHGTYNEEEALYAADGQSWAFYFDAFDGKYLRSRSA